MLLNLHDGPPLSNIAAAALLAAAPLFVLLLCVEATQLYRPEPRGAKIWALVWGALIATGMSAYLNSLVGTAADFAAVVFYAPVIEETTKACGLLLLLRYGRIRNALDGVVYAMIVGAGFAAVENVYYFLTAIDVQLSGRDPGALAAVFFARGIVSPFAHPLFTAATGAAIGLSYGRRLWPWLPPLGLAVGAFLHSMWNYGAVTGHLWRFSFLAFGAFALAALWLLLAVWRERAAFRRNRTNLPAELRAALAPVPFDGRTVDERDAAQIRRREAFRQAVTWHQARPDWRDHETLPPPAAAGPDATPAATWSAAAPWYSRPPDPATRVEVDDWTRTPDEADAHRTDNDR